MKQKSPGQIHQGIGGNYMCFMITFVGWMQRVLGPGQQKVLKELQREDAPPFPFKSLPDHHTNGRQGAFMLRPQNVGDVLRVAYFTYPDHFILYIALKEHRGKS